MKKLGSYILLLPLFVTLAAHSPTVYGQDNPSGVGRDGQAIPEGEPTTPEEAVERFTKDLTHKAANGWNELFVGESAKIQEIIDLIKAKQSVYLVSDAGAGKTSTVEQVALELHNQQKNLPEAEQTKILALNSSAFEAGTMFRGSQEARLQLILEGFLASQGKKIMFIDEFHVMMKVPKFMDTLKPAMANGELTIIGATTRDEYTRDIESDRAMNRRGQLVEILAPTMDKVLTILRAQKANYQAQYGFSISDVSLQRIAQATFRIFPSEAPISQAMKILKKAAALLRNERLGTTSARAKLQDQIQALTHEIDSLKSDLHFVDDRDILQERISKLEAERSQLKSEITQIEEVAKYQIRHRELSAKLLDPTTPLDQKATIQLKDLPTVEQKLISIGAAPAENLNVLNERFVNRAVGEMSGYSQDYLNESKDERVAKLGDRMKSEIIGQDHIIDTIVRKTKTIRANVGVRSAPISIFIAGSTGVGKTFIAQKLAQFDFGSEQNLTRVNMGNYKSQESVWGLTGPKRGFVDSEKGGEMTEPIRRKPGQVLLLDEYEKAHMSTGDAIMPILETGLVADGNGRMVNYGQSAIILTSNVGAEFALDKLTMDRAQLAEKYGFNPKEFAAMSEQAMDEAVLRKLMIASGMKPELVNRIDVLVLAKSLSYRAMVVIVETKLKKAADEFRALQGVELKYDRSVIFSVARAGYDRQFGARPLNRAIETHIKDLLADMIVDQHAKSGDVVELKFNRTHATGGVITGSLNGQVRIQNPLAFRTQVDIDRDLQTAKAEEARTDAVARAQDAAAAAKAQRAARLRAIPAKARPVVEAPRTGAPKPAPSKNRSPVRRVTVTPKPNEAAPAAAKPTPQRVSAPQPRVQLRGETMVEMRARRAMEAQASAARTTRDGKVDTRAVVERVAKERK